jgi:hypothetical protein
MQNDDFWSVQLGIRMGPLVLGSEYEPVLQALRDHRVDVDRLRLDRSGKLSVQDIHTQLLFSDTYPRTLVRIDVEDKQLRFGPLVVIGKRAHEIIGLFKVSRKKTLWCSVATNSDSSDLVANGNTTSQSRELLARGTIWIPGLGLGLTLRDGLVGTVHLCEPSQAPRNGTGSWTKEQQRLSEVREMPALATAPTLHKSRTILSVVIHLALVASIGTLIWWVMQLQRRWDAATEVPAVVVAVDPPPPNVLPTYITLSFNDSAGTEHRPTLGYMQFEMTPKLGDEVNIRYLPDAPDKVLGPAAFRVVGFDSAFPYGMGILAIYSVLQLIVVGALPFRASRRPSL